MLKFIMMSGPSGSGKSTVVREMMRKDPNLVRLNRDDLRAMSIDRWMPSKERWIIDSEVALARVACQLRKNVVIDDTNLMDKDAIKWEAVASEFPNYLFSKQLITASIKECVERDSKRVGKARVGGAVIERQFLRAKLWNVPPGKKICIFDIDGTMADLEHRIPWITIGAPCPNCSLQGRPDYVSTGFGDVPPGFNSFENGNWICEYCGCPGDNSCDEDKRRLSKKFHDMFYSLCNYDAPIEIVIKWIQACYDEFYVLIVSGRSPENGTYEATVKWLEDKGIKYHHLLMRRSYHHGPDTEEKQLILNDILAMIPKENIAFVVDDRPSVIQMWRSNGLTVIPVRGRDDDKFYADVKKLQEITCP